MLDKFIEIFQGLDIAYGEYFLEGSRDNKTGKEKSGDTSNNIRMGKVVRTVENSEIEIPEKLAHKMNEQYLDVIDLIEKRSL